ncbi:cation efflux family [Mucor ambiguus]|uniref:Cation efflux family n=1 Tax=Mucor ambiguus TaxID=91626 RepID=A0A0C9MIT1_9FUNG|nr:cation efflux family [Mucor ambiguus]
MQSTAARHMLGCTRLSLQTSKRSYATLSLYTNATWRRALIQQQHSQTATLNTAFNRPRTAWLIGSVRQHGTHGHHHHDADLMASLKSSSKKGTRITVIGLASNVGLTIAKGAAGWVMNSASLLAEALHSFSDLLSDFVTLYTFKMSRKPADSIYPYGYGKFETVGSVTVSSLLLAGAVGIGWHSFDLLLATLQTAGPLVSDTTATVVAAASTNVAENATPAAAAAASPPHVHGHGGVLDPNAAWFALASVLIKEWLYRATIKVGRSERSEVLMANAWHHRSDAYSSAVALVAIVGSYAGMPVLDPLGGIVVSGMLVKSSVGLLGSSMKELMDKGISPEQLDEITGAISKVKDTELDLIDFHSVRGRKQGPFNHIDLVLQLSPTISMEKAYRIEELVRSSVKSNCDNIQDILIYLEDVKAAAEAKKRLEHEHEHEHHHHDSH